MDGPDGTTFGEEDEGWEPRIETCRIVLWRGYRTASFYARPEGDPSGTSIGAPSSSFRLRGSEAPDTREARLAHEELVSKLEANGWFRTGTGDDWFEAEFARTTLLAARRAAEVADEREDAVLEPEPDHAVPVARSPAPAVAETLPAAAEAGPRRRVDRWRVAAATGLAVAIGLVGWLATHPTSLRASSAAIPAARH